MQCVTLLLILVDTGLKELYLPLLVTGIHCAKWWVWKHICQYQWSWDKPYSPGCNHLRPMLQFGSKHVSIEDAHIFKDCHKMTLFFVVDWDILYKLCGSENKWSKGFVLSGKIWWQFFSCSKACSKYHTCRTTTPKYALPQRLVYTSKTLVYTLIMENSFAWT